MVSTVVIVLAVALVGSVGWFVGKPFVTELTKPKNERVGDYSGPGHGEASITIEAGDTGAQIAEKLVAAGVIASTGPFVAAFTEAGEQAASIQPGTYALRQEMSAQDALTALMDPASRRAITFTVPEGKRADEVYQIVGQAMAQAEVDDGADPAQRDAIAADRTEQLRVAGQDATAIGLPPEAAVGPEGWLFPNTYSFNLGTEPAEILAEMVAQTVKVLDEVQVPRERWLEVLTVASLVEKESKLEPDRPKVARVVYNRLEKGMKLQFDSTVVYGVGRFDDEVDTTDAERAADNPYNTYKIQGLPAGPICNPGLVAIKGAVEPAAGAWLYFCAVNLDTGETEFNDTPEGHEGCVAKYQAWAAGRRQ
jgi:UPF0755 protein